MTAAIVEDVVGHDDTLPFPSWCWIDTSREDVLAWQYLSGKGWEVACYVLTVMLYVSVKIHLVRQVSKMASRFVWVEFLKEKCLAVYACKDVA